MLKETLRLYPTAPGTSRDILEDIVIDGVRVPAGVICFVSRSLLSVCTSKIGKCVRIQNIFIVCFCFKYIKDNGSYHLKDTHNQTGCFLEDKA